MLDADTKRRIDACRDILVGKVPNPAAQVEQITVALIYKFMNDMDLEAEELGGKARFFSGGFEQYRWAALTAPGVSGRDMIDAYSEALAATGENEVLPLLFRRIFRDASLPYRDPETLRLFLREIDGFTYDHSERLGDAFEYLLSILGSQGDAGQFRTPRHIIDFMVAVMDPQKHETVLDPACGTAGFLISAYKHVLRRNSTAPENGAPPRPGDLLTAAERAALAGNIGGYDISPDMVRLSLVNLYLHRFVDPKVEEYDTLTSDDKWNETADVILANPPFMSPKGGIKPHNRFQVRSTRSEVLFVDYIAEHLAPGGRAAVIVPEGVIFQSQKAYVALRKTLVESRLAAVVSLPAGVFNPYSGVKTSILILDRAAAKACAHVAFFKVENDGFDLGAQRKPQKGSQLSQATAELSAWLRTARAGGGADLQSPLGFSVPRTAIAESGDYNLIGERYREKKAKPSQFEYRALRVFCDLGAGNPAPQGNEYFEGGVLPFIRTSDVGQVHRSVRFTGAADKLTPKAVAERRLRLFPAGTILFPKSGASTFLNHRVMLGKPAYVSSHLACITPRPDFALPEYVYHMLCRVDARDLVPDQAYPSLRLDALGNLEIPLPPLEIQREIVAEVEGYRRVIDGARAVIDNYRPRVPIDPAWETVPLGEVCDVVAGQSPKAKFYNDEGHGLPFYQGKKEFTDRLLGPPTTWTTVVTKRAEPDDILMSVRAPVGPINEATQTICIGRGLAAIKVKRDKKLDRKFLWSVLLQLQPTIKGNPGAVFESINKADIERLSIPLPPLETQKSIAAEFEAEQSLVNGNRDLIARFEKKIAAAIARVWEGEEAA